MFKTFYKIRQSLCFSEYFRMHSSEWIFQNNSEYLQLETLKQAILTVIQIVTSNLDIY